MFEGFKQFDRIFVTGPQRSGTRVCSHMIAADTGHEHVDEFQFGTDQWEVLRDNIMRPRNGTGKFVVQCPGLAYKIHEVVNSIPERSCVVLMCRNAKDIALSQERINWLDERYEKQKYVDVWGKKVQWDDSIADIKYYIWHNFQRGLIPYHFEVFYETLQEHMYWVSPELRKTFAEKQWKL